MIRILLRDMTVIFFSHVAAQGVFLYLTLPSALPAHWCVEEGVQPVLFLFPPFFLSSLIFLFAFSLHSLPSCLGRISFHAVPCPPSHPLVRAAHARRWFGHGDGPSPPLLPRGDWSDGWVWFAGTWR
ncbi:hypothetical protein F4677DRAFT_22651 [Hypoxylon crocopeplum]|nr:hypothetical protein F4677DRAFT_22651 [Hypoxylon crocopeplum]